MKFHEKAEMLAKNNNLTHADLAKKCGVSESQIHFVMNGKTKNPGLKIILGIAQAIGVEPGELLSDIDKPE